MPDPGYATPARAVDRILVDGTGADLVLRASFPVSSAEPLLAGHFPGLPIWPGVLMIEAVEQATRHALAVTGHPGALMSAVLSARFLHPVVPGDEMLLDITIRANGPHAWVATGEITIADSIACAKIRAGFTEPGA